MLVMKLLEHPAVAKFSNDGQVFFKLSQLTSGAFQAGLSCTKLIIMEFRGGKFSFFKNKSVPLLRLAANVVIY